MSEWWESAYKGGGPAKPKGFPRPLYPPDVGGAYEPSVDGPDVVAYKRTICKLGRWGDWDPDSWDDTYSNNFAHGKGTGNVKDSGVEGFQRQQNIQPTGRIGEQTFTQLRYCLIPEGPNKGKQAMDSVAVNLINEACDLFWKPPDPPPDKVPNLGPVFNGGTSVLKHDLTHSTGGIPLYPAFDDAFSQGCTIIAPEALTVTRASSSSPGDACYCDGASGLRWWFGHLSAAPDVGRKISKGAKLGVTCENHVGGGPHVHVGINVENLWGKGKEMTHYTSYSHGAPTVGDQLEAGRPL